VARGRLFLIHWNAEEAEQLAAPLRKDGWEVAVESQDGARAGKAILTDPPDAVLIHLARMPSHGRETAGYLKSSKAGRELPIIFVGGADDVVAKTKKKVKGAQFVSDDGLRRALARYASI
jgi:DNA-binding response OmpR family regulator